MSERVANREASSSGRHHPALNHWIFAPVRWVIRLWRRISMRTVDVDAAQPKLDQLIDDAEHGKPFQISIHGKPMIKVSRMEVEDVERLPKADEPGSKK